MMPDGYSSWHLQFKKEPGSMPFYSVRIFNITGKGIRQVHEFQIFNPKTVGRPNFVADALGSWK